MLKIVANVSKKVPIPGLDFSSQSFMAGIEVEVSDGSTQEQLQHRIREVYHLLEHVVDTEIRSYGGVPQMDNAARGMSPTPTPTQVAHRLPDNDATHAKQFRASGQTPPLVAGATHSKQKARTATQAQQKAVYAIAKAKGIGRDALIERLRREFGVDRPDDLTVSDASAVIDTLKRGS